MRFLVVPVVLSIIILPSCGRESPTGSPQAASIRISPAEAVLDAIGATVQLTASVRDGNDREVADAAVTWTSNNTEVASETVRGPGHGPEERFRGRPGRFRAIPYTDLGYSILCLLIHHQYRRRF